MLLLGLALRPVPSVLFQPPASAAMRLMRRRHPGVFDRLSSVPSPVYLIDPIDLPMAFVLDARPDRFRLTVVDDIPEEEVAATIRAPLGVLLDLLQGRTDADAMFFARALTIDGRTDAVVALRNAVESADIDLVADFAAACGPFEAPARTVAETIAGLAGRAAEDMEMVRRAVVARGAGGPGGSAGSAAGPAAQPQPATQGENPW